MCRREALPALATAHSLGSPGPPRDRPRTIIPPSPTPTSQGTICDLMGGRGERGRGNGAGEDPLLPPKPDMDMVLARGQGPPVYPP